MSGYARDHVHRACTRPATALHTNRATRMDTATRTYVKGTTYDAPASPKRPRTHALDTVQTTELGENHGPARASPPARDAIGHGSGTPPTH